MENLNLLAFSLGISKANKWNENQNTFNLFILIQIE